MKKTKQGLFRTVQEETRTFIFIHAYTSSIIMMLYAYVVTLKKNNYIDSHLPNACTTLTSYYEVRSGRIPLQLENQQTFLAAGVD